MKAGKLIKWSILIVLLVVIVAVTLVIMRIDAIVKTQVETQGTTSTKLATTLNSAHLSLFGGTLKLNDMKIGQPEGFTAPTMFEMGGLHVGVSYGQLMGNPITIDEITVDSPKLVVEHANGKINVYSAMQAMPPSEPSTMRLIIGKLSLNNTQVVVRPGISMLQPEYALTLPSITVTNIGNAEGAQNGAAMKDVLKTVLTAMMEKVKESDKIPASVRPLLTGNSADIKAAATQQAMQYLQQNKDVQNVQKQLDSILGGKK